MQFYKHLTTMLDDEWIQDQLMDRYGLEGYGFWCGILEIYAKFWKMNPTDLKVAIPIKVLQRKLRIRSTKVELLLNFCSTSGKLLSEVVEQVCYIEIPKMPDLMGEYDKRLFKNLRNDSEKYAPQNKEERNKKQETRNYDPNGSAASGQNQFKSEQKKEKKISHEPNQLELLALPEKPSPKGGIFGPGLDYLVHCGGEQAACRSFLAMLLKRHGEDETFNAILAMLEKEPADPKSYLRAILAKKPSPAQPTTDIYGRPAPMVPIEGGEGRDLTAELCGLKKNN